MTDSQPLLKISKSFLYPAVATLLGGFFFFSATAKALYWRDVADALEGLFVNETMALAATPLLVIFEYVLGVLFLTPRRWKTAGVLSVAALLVFTIVALGGKMLGLLTECPCFGRLFGSDIGLGLVVRNVVLLGLSTVLLKQPYVLAPKEASVTFPRLLTGAIMVLVLLNVVLLGRILPSLLQ